MLWSRFLLVQELLIYGTIYQLTQWTLAVFASFVHQLVQVICLDYVHFTSSDAFTVLLFRPVRSLL